MQTEEKYFLRHRLTLTFIFSFLVGILTASLVKISPPVALLLLIIALTIFLAEKIWNKEVQKEVLYASIIILAFGLGVTRFDIKDFHVPDPVFESKVGQKVEFTGLVVSEPERRDSYTRMVVRSGSEKILVSTDLYSRISYGDEIGVSGKLGKPEVIDDGIGRPFDYKAYLSREDIYYTLSFTSAEVLSQGHGNRIRNELFNLKHALVGKMREILPEPESSLLAGLIVAGKDSMPKTILEEFRRAGVIHIVVLSGYNITIIADFLRRFFGHIALKLKFSRARLISGLASMVGILLFVLMTGAEPTVVRAAIMVTTVILAGMLAREYSAFRALLVAAFLMVFVNPKILIFDPSFQLSFLATLALIYVVPVVERYLNKVPNWWNARGILVTTIGTQITVLPYLVYSMGEVSLVSLPANMLILFFIPATMFLGFIATLLGFASTLLAIPFAYAAHLLLSWILLVSETLGNLKFAAISVPLLPIWIILAVYLAMIILIRRLQSFSHKFANSN